MNRAPQTGVIADPTQCPVGCRPSPRSFKLAGGEYLRWCRLCGALWRFTVYGGVEGAIVQVLGLGCGAGVRFYPLEPQSCYRPPDAEGS